MSVCCVCVCCQFIPQDRGRTTSCRRASSATHQLNWSILLFEWHPTHLDNARQHPYGTHWLLTGNRKHERRRASRAVCNPIRPDRKSAVEGKDGKDSEDTG